MGEIFTSEKYFELSKLSLLITPFSLPCQCSLLTRLVYLPYFSPPSIIDSISKYSFPHRGMYPYLSPISVSYYYSHQFFQYPLPLYRPWPPPPPHPNLHPVRETSTPPLTLSFFLSSCRFYYWIISYEIYLINFFKICFSIRFLNKIICDFCQKMYIFGVYSCVEKYLIYWCFHWMHDHLFWWFDLLSYHNQPDSEKFLSIFMNVHKNSAIVYSPLGVVLNTQ